MSDIKLNMLTLYGPLGSYRSQIRMHENRTVSAFNDNTRIVRGFAVFAAIALLCSVVGAAVPQYHLAQEYVLNNDQKEDLREDGQAAVVGGSASIAAGAFIGKVGTTSLLSGIAATGALTAGTILSVTGVGLVVIGVGMIA